MSRKAIEAVAVFERSRALKGYVTLKETSKGTTITAHVDGLKPNREYAWHIHEAGDLRVPTGKSKPCDGACAHYNPHNKNHGGPRSRDRHVGDLGNIKTDSNGSSRSSVTLSSVKLHGKYSVIGRSIVIHIKADDMGKGGTEESLKTGSAGARIACGVIGYAKGSRLYF